MAKWVSFFYNEEFEDEEAAREAAAQSIEIDDIVNQIGNDLTIWDLVEELGRLESPLYYQLLEAAIEAEFSDFYTELEEDD